MPLYLLAGVGARVRVTAVESPSPHSSLEARCSFTLLSKNTIVARRLSTPKPVLRSSNSTLVQFSGRRTAFYLPK